MRRRAAPYRAGAAPPSRTRRRARSGTRRARHPPRAGGAARPAGAPSAPLRRPSPQPGAYLRAAPRGRGARAEHLTVSIARITTRRPFLQSRYVRCLGKVCMPKVTPAPMELVGAGSLGGGGWRRRLVRRQATAPAPAPPPERWTLARSTSLIPGWRDSSACHRASRRQRAEHCESEDSRETFQPYEGVDELTTSQAEWDFVVSLTTAPALRAPPCWTEKVERPAQIYDAQGARGASRQQKR